MNYKPLTEEDRAALLRELDDHEAGTNQTGRWLNEIGAECAEGDEGASWYEYDVGENATWTLTVANMMARMRKILTRENEHDTLPENRHTGAGVGTKAP